VDLLPDGQGDYTVLELNGAVDFTPEYSLGVDPFAAAMWQLARIALGCLKPHPARPVPPEESVLLQG
ncbi:MAG: hypothetical protein H0V45_08305, partial [Actinobacteria bacterium]|nr:hypothetical protein [Actinomycetota bacterium]